MKEEMGRAKQVCGLCCLAPSPRLWVSLSLLFCLPLFFSPSAYGAWSRQESGTMAWLRAVYFLDEQKGWAVGGNGALLSTVDGGGKWQVQRRPSEDTLRDVYFASDQLGWLVCDRSIYLLKTKEEPRSYLLKTIDGGTTWKRVEATGKDIDVQLLRVVFADAEHGYVFGEEGALYVTDDGGNSWTHQNVPTRHLLLGGAFLNPYAGWIVGAGNTILQTSDGGAQWHFGQAPLNAETRFNAITFADARHGWVVGSRGVVLATTNGGRTWQAQESAANGIDLFDVKFLDAKEGWAVGAEGTIIHTLDGGAHWRAESSETHHPLERLFFVNHTRGWAVGFGGTIINYTSNVNAPPILKTNDER